MIVVVPFPILPFPTRNIMGLFDFIRRAGKPERRYVDRQLRFRKRSVITADRDLYEAADFLRLLYLERRKSERFSRPLCLILLEGTTISDTTTRESAFRHIFDQLRASIRETDIVGWYTQNSIMAVIFPDLNSTDETVVNTVRNKVSTAVTVALPAELVKHIRLSTHLFPNTNDRDSGVSDLALYPELPFRYQARKTAHAMKRLIDIGSSLILLCLLSPLFALIAFAIKANSKGPVIFRQVRVGEHGRLFSFLKFRSMYVGNDAAIHKKYVTTLIARGEPANGGDAVYKITDDPRVTLVGRFLRKTSLDELPQLWNVLCGDMSLVGPRPPLPYEFDCYALWHRRRIIEIKPGITGLWQVTGRSRISFNDMVRLDLKYAKDWSIWLDIKILLQTPKAVLMGEGAY